MDLYGWVWSFGIWQPRARTRLFRITSVCEEYAYARLPRSHSLAPFVWWVHRQQFTPECVLIRSYSIQCSDFIHTNPMTICIIVIVTVRFYVLVVPNMKIWKEKKNFTWQTQHNTREKHTYTRTHTYTMYVIILSIEVYLFTI